MKYLKLIPIIIACMALFACCNTSKDASFSKNGIQKRKYTKGYYANLSLKKTKKSKAIDRLSARKQKPQEKANITEQPKIIYGLSTESKNDEVPLIASQNNNGATQLLSSSMDAQAAAKAFFSPTTAELNKKLNFTNQKKKAKEKEEQQLIKDARDGPNLKTDDMLVLYVILGILLPPLGVYLYEGSITTNFWVDLIFALFGLIFWPFLVYGGSLLYLVAIIFALLVILAGVSL